MTTSIELIEMTKAALCHCDGWRSAFIPLDDDEEKGDRDRHWAPMMAAALANNMQALVDLIMAETAYYAAVELKTHQRWNFYSDKSFLIWHQQYPQGMPLVLDSQDPLICRQKVLNQLYKLSAAHRQHELG